MKYIESPTDYPGAGKDIKLFLAGGITGTENWQAQAVKLMENSNLTLINPRRKNWDNIDLKSEEKVIEVQKKLDDLKLTLSVNKLKLEHNKNDYKDIENDIKGLQISINAYENRLKELTVERLQIEWEYWHLLRADAIMFWFPPETLCPIALFELGSYIIRPKPLFVGCHPDYKRKKDVEIQMRLARPREEVSSSLIEVIDKILRWESKQNETVQS